MQKQSLKYEALLLLMSILWGSTFVAQQIGMAKGVGPLTFNGLRFTLGCLSLLPVIHWRSKHLPRSPADRHLPVGGSLLAGLFLFAAANFQQVGLLYTSSANAGFITSLYIVFVPLLGLFFKHRAPRSLWTGITVCVIGLYLLSITRGFRIGFGDGLVLICALLWAGQILVVGHVATRGDPIKIAVLQFAVCAGLSTLAAILFETWSVHTLVAGSGAMAYAGILSVGVAFTLQVVCQKRCPPGPAAVIMSLEAVFAALAGYLVLKQTLTLRALTGCALILCGVLIVQLVPMLRRRALVLRILGQSPSQEAK